MNEVAERFSNLTRKTMSDLKRSYASCQTNLLKSAVLAYQLKCEDELQFVDFATNELQISKGTLSKMLSAGKLMIEKPDYIELPKSYVSVYELTKVSEEIESFNSFVETEKETTLKELSNRQAHKFVEEYTKRNEETEETEETEIDESTNTETETEDNETLSIFENLLNLAQDAKSRIATNYIEMAISDLTLIIEILEKQV